MSKRMSETVGYITCPFCLSNAEVAQTPGKNYRYIYCLADGCKPTQNLGQAYQAHIEDNMRETLEPPLMLPSPERFDASRVDDEQALEVDDEQVLETKPEDDQDEKFWPFD